MSQASKFPPSPAFSGQAHISSETMLENFRKTARDQPEAFFGELARALSWDRSFSQLLDWQCPVAKWFVGGALNVAVNCLDKHIAAQGDKTALIWEGEPLSSSNAPEIRKVSYKELLELTCQIANALKEQGIGKGDRVAIYMPMLPETVASMLACARIGAIHTVIFGGFSATSIYDRCVDCGVKALLCADGTWRRGKWLGLKPIVDEALSKPGHSVERVFVYQRDAKQEIKLNPVRDLLFKDTVAKQPRTCKAESLDSEHPLFILYTSGSTGKPKGLFHTQAGYLLWAHWSTRWLFDLKPNDVYWCSADCGWITGHTYVTYGPLSNGATVFIYEGAPLHPTPDRFWQMIDRHKVSIFYTAPTAIRTFMRFGEDFPRRHNLTSLRVLGTVGEPINPEAWIWYQRAIGMKRCPIVDTWWQTETGGALIAPFPGATSTKPGSATKPLPGIEADVVNPETGAPCKTGERGALVIKRPWPAMARGIWGDPKRFESLYWRSKPHLDGIYFTSDYAMKDEDGDFWIEGRMDDVIKVSGHRIGSAEVESALVSHAAICEAAAIGIPDEIKGQSIVAFVTLNDQTSQQVKLGKIRIDNLKTAARDHVGRELGSFAKPDQIRIASALPKTRSGKIMRRLLRELATTGVISGDTTTLEDFSAQAALSEEE